MSDLTVNVYKLTDQDGCTRDATQWGPGVTHSATGSGKDLCSDGWIHFYEDAFLAILHNPIHADFRRPRLWEASIGPGEVLRDGQLKGGCKTLTVLREIPVPRISMIQKIAYGIYCALEVYQAPYYVSWAHSWLSGEDRTTMATARAAEATRTEAAKMAAWAAWAAWAATKAAAAGVSMRAAAAAWTAEAARDVVMAAAVAAQVAGAVKEINLSAQAQKAMRIRPNLALGLFEDSLARLERAYYYIRVGGRFVATIGPA